MYASGSFLAFLCNTKHVRNAKRDLHEEVRVEFPKPTFLLQISTLYVLFWRPFSKKCEFIIKSKKSLYVRTEVWDSWETIIRTNRSRASSFSLPVVRRLLLLLVNIRDWIIIIIIRIIIIVIIRYACLLSQAFSSWYFYWTSDDPHCSGFKLHTAVFSVLCVMSQV